MLTKATRAATLPLLLLAAAAPAAENLLPQGVFQPGPRKLPKGWRPDKNWMASRFKLLTEEGERFLRVSESPARLVGRSDLPDGVKRVTLAVRARLDGFQQGEKPWDVPTVTLRFVGTDGTEGKSEWKDVLKFREDHDWAVAEHTMPVPDAAAAVDVEISYKGKSGRFDVAWVIVYDAAKPRPEPTPSEIPEATIPAAKPGPKPKPRPAAKAPAKVKPSAGVVDAVLLDGFEGELGRMPEGWRAAGKDKRGGFVLAEADGKRVARSTRSPALIRTDVMLPGPTPMTVTFRARVRELDGVPADKLPNVSLAYAAIGGIESGYAKGWQPDAGDAGKWVSVRRELDGGGSNTRRLRLILACPAGGVLEVAEPKVVAHFAPAGQAEPAGGEDPMFGPSEKRREVDPSRITGPEIDESAVKVTLHVNPASPRASDLNPGTDPDRPMRTIQSALNRFRDHHAAFTGPVRVLLWPGVYRLTDALEIDNYMWATRKQLLVIEGKKPGEVVISGSVTEGFEPQTWELVDAERKIYRHDWHHDWGLVNRGYYTTAHIVTHRRELVAVNGKLLRPRILERYTYVDKRGRVYNDVGLLVAEGKPKGKPGYTYMGFAGVEALEPGQFGVAELGPGDGRYQGHEHDHPDSLFLRLPEGVDKLEGATVEVGFAPTLLRSRNKWRLVLRNLIFRHAASWYLNYFDTAAVDIGYDPLVSGHVYDLKLQPKDVVIEDCVFEDNLGTGLKTRALDGFAIRRCTIRNNGCEGFALGHARNGIVEDVEVTGNNRVGHLGGLKATPHGGGGINLSAMDVLFRNVRSHHNHGAGLRGDVIATNLIFENCDFNYNQKRGHWHEISWGPILLKNCRLIGNDGMGFFLLNVHDVTLDGCIVADNTGPQFGFNHSDVRESPPSFEASLGGHGGVANQRSTGFVLRNCTVVTRRGADSRMVERISASAPLYRQFVREEFRGENNTYWNPDATDVFDVTGAWHNRKFVGFAAWQAATGSEKTSRWAKPDIDIPAE